MLTNTLDILVFSKDCDFSDETNDILIASKIKYISDSPKLNGSSRIF